MPSFGNYSCRYTCVDELMILQRDAEKITQELGGTETSLRFAATC
jgi:hypothetical protein